MRKKKLPQKALTPLSAITAGFALAAGAHAQTTPVFNYSFPASWAGAGTTITDLSFTGNNGGSDGTIGLAETIPPGAGGSTLSLDTTAGGILTGATSTLNNAAIATAGGFTYNVSFLWNGTDSSSFGHTEKLIDYAGTESLQLVTTAGSASLQMAIADDAGNESIPVSATIVSNTWYNVAIKFDTTGNSVDGNGDISGLVSMTVNGGIPITAAATKGTYGDSLDRPLGVGQLGAPFGYLVGFKGDIYNPSVTLGIAPYFLPANKMTNGNVSLSLIAPQGFIYQIQGSTNLTTWTNLASIASTNGTIPFTDTNTHSFSRRFYRALVVN